MVRRPSDREIASQFNELRLALPSPPPSLARRPLANPFGVAWAKAADLRPPNFLAFPLGAGKESESFFRPQRRMAIILKPENVARLVFFVRGEKVMLDADLAVLYGVTTKALNQAGKRNSDRFPSDFMFRLTKQETESLIFQSGRSNRPLRSQIVTTSQRK